VLGDTDTRVQTMDVLKKAAGFVRKRLAEVINLRLTPQVLFVFDDSIEHGMRMARLIDEVNRPLRAASNEQTPP
jgi:ribosome-binding factor A